MQFEPVPFHKITIDLVVGLPLWDGFNALQIGTCMFSKRVFLIVGKDTWTAEQWARPFVSHLMMLEMGGTDGDHMRSRPEVLIGFLEDGL